MKRLALLGLMVSATWACSSSPGDGGSGNVVDPLTQCPQGQTVLYSKVTPPSAGANGASGIGAAPAVLAGDAGSSSGGSGGTPSTGVGGPAPSPGPSPTPSPTPTPTPPSGEPFASTATSCVPAVCPAGQVAVPKMSMTSSGGGAGGVSSGGVAEGPPVVMATDAGVPSSPPVPTPVPPAPTPAPTPIDPSAPSAGDVICTAPPDTCPSGQSPSYAPAGYWHCMPMCDPNNQNLVVISYGGIYGNGGVCAGPPPQQACPVDGQVWTWNFLSEEWDCESKCDNGQYDQRTFANQTVCVPC